MDNFGFYEVFSVQNSKANGKIAWGLFVSQHHKKHDS